MIRFSSSPVPFAARQYVLPAGHVMTGAQLAQLVRQNAEPRDVAIVCSDRATLIALTKAFRSAMGIDKRPAPVVAPAPRFGKVALIEASDAAREEVARLGSTASPEAKAEVAAAVASVTSASLAERWGAVVDRQANRIAELEAQLVEAQDTITALQVSYDELERDAARAAVPAPKAKRAPRAKAPKAEAPRECISDDGLSTY